jgi:hypothetical protein
MRRLGQTFTLFPAQSLPYLTPDRWARDLFQALAYLNNVNSNDQRIPNFNL